jgi:hypothetical protein
MEIRDLDVAPLGSEVQEMIEPDIIRQIRELTARGWGSKRIAAELGVARNTVRRYLRGGAAAEAQVRPARRCLDEDGRAEAKQLFTGLAESNAVVVAGELVRRGITVSPRTVQRVVAELRRGQRAADVASVRFETAPGYQMQIDLGLDPWRRQKSVRFHGVARQVRSLGPRPYPLDADARRRSRWTWPPCAVHAVHLSAGPGAKPPPRFGCERRKNRGAGEATFGGLTAIYFATGDNSGRENATH